MSPLEPYAGKSYPDHPSPDDGVAAEVMRRLAALQAEVTADPEERCRRFWSVLRRLYVADPAHAERIDWGRCHLPNERAFLSYWTQSLLPAIRGLALTRERLAAVRVPALVVHGRQDRSVPYGAAREWATLLPNARLVTIEGAAHAPWIEAPEQVLAAVETFLAGGWPEAAEPVGRPPR
jgi:pimeloyl-ACP methyl ester carboxylesterase